MEADATTRIKSGKLTGSPPCSVLWEGCQNSDSACHLCLNATSISPNSFFLSLTSQATCNPLHPFQTLLDSGLSHSFINKAFALKNRLKFLYLLNVGVAMRDHMIRISVHYQTFLYIMTKLHFLLFFPDNYTGGNSCAFLFSSVLYRGD